ncbi:hypothetical protein QQ045_018137 [Rhodiola kirilowii]
MADEGKRRKKTTQDTGRADEGERRKIQRRTTVKITTHPGFKHVAAIFNEYGGWYPISLEYWRKRKNEDGKKIESSDKNMPNKGPATKKAKLVIHIIPAHKLLKEDTTSSVDLQSANSDDDFEDNNMEIVLPKVVPNDHKHIPNPKKTAGEFSSGVL